MEINKQKASENEKIHPIEDATVHYICKQILVGDIEREKYSLTSNNYFK